MLILTRCIDEIITIGDNVWIKILDIGNSHVRIGVNAPREIAVYRGEIYANLSKRDEPVDDASNNM